MRSPEPEVPHPRPLAARCLPLIRNHRQPPTLGTSGALLHENWDYASAAADNVSITRATEPRVLRASIGVGLHKHFFRTQLGGSVKIDGINSLVGTERYDSANAAVDRGFNYVLSTI